MKFKAYLKCVIASIFVLFFCSANAVEWRESPAVARLFVKTNVKGAFVLYDIKHDRLIGHNHTRAETRFIPASTFKIPNSLIGLSVGAVNSVDDIFPYDGKPTWRKECDKDMDLREAFKLSCVPVYQEVARRIGLKRMQYEVSKLNYGNKHIGTVVDEFWLEGPLKISAIEQSQFLKKLAQKTLPFSAEVQEKVHDIARSDQGDDWVLYSKTGWTGPGTKEKPGIGWWVGWVKKGERLYTFALNMDMSDVKEAPNLFEIGRGSLKKLGVINLIK